MRKLILKKYKYIVILMGDYFTSKDEAIQYYKSNYKNLEDNPTGWLTL